MKFMKDEFPYRIWMLLYIDIVVSDKDFFMMLQQIIFALFLSKINHIGGWPLANFRGRV